MFDSDEENEAVEADPPEPAEGIDPGTSEASDEGEQTPPSIQRRGQEDSDAGSSSSSSEQDGVEVEEALKELSARMSRISTNLEGVEQSRGQLEEKLGNVEERLSHLGSLAEAVSSEYNPFISENAPDQPSWTPEGDSPEAGDLPASGLPPSPEEPSNPPADDAPPEGSDPGPEPAQPEEGPEQIPRTDPESITPREEPEPEPEPQPRQRSPARRGQERSRGDNLEENLILLEWVGMMLDRVGRAGLMDLLDYYQNLGWLDRETKDQATRVAVGVDAPDTVGDGQWRGDLELHRRSLVAIERLQGQDIPAARLDELELDLRRLFREK